MYGQAAEKDIIVTQLAGRDGLTQQIIKILERCI